ncbi:MAG: SulP family inorganic anion transporter [Clostridia bacterium]|nr:SulP family inorganic anion transporter [Clostridia bacterium]
MKADIAGNIRQKFFPYKHPGDFFKDIAGGIIIALVSIPISMGYAQISGLPMQYGLYGSVLPILLFALLTSSRDFVFGVDAAPAALVGTTIAALEITPGSQEAMQIVPLIALFVSGWLLIFFIFKAGRIVRYISEPVMGGFVSGICCTIILMQIPKLFGGAAGIGEAPELIEHIISELKEFNGWSMLIGCLVIFIIVLFRHIAPKIPMSVVMMASGVILGCCLPLADIGVNMMPEVEPGFPAPKLPVVGFDLEEISEVLFHSLSIAAVILAESLLASKSYATKDGYKLDANREILSYSLANLASSLTGCCPVNGSVSRTGIARQFGVKSQWMSVFASGAMVIVLFAANPLIRLLPVPVLTAIVISALIGACEFGLAKRLFKASKQEFLIFMGAFLGVLVFGTVYGVIIGIVLSFFAVIVKVVTPPRTFMGVIPGRTGFYSLERSREARPLKRAVIYRFGGNMFFANTDVIKNDIESAVKDDTTCVIINAGAVSSIDTAAAEELLYLYKHFRSKNIRFYMTGHIGTVNDSLRRFGADELIKNGAVRMTIALALRDAGIKKPYEPEGGGTSEKAEKSTEIEGDAADQGFFTGLQAELEWALGDSAEDFRKQLTEEIYQSLKKDKELTGETIEKISSLTRWGKLNMFDEDELLDRLETRLLDRAIKHPDQAERIVSALEERRKVIETAMPAIDSKAMKRLSKRRLERAYRLYSNDPQAFEHRKKKRLKYLSILDKTNPELAQRYRAVYKELLSMYEEKDVNI